MKRRTFLKGAAVVAMASTLARFGVPTIGRAAELKRVAFGGIRIECSTYTPILTRMQDFAIRREDALADMPIFSMLKQYPYSFQPDLKWKPFVVVSAR